MSAQYDPKRTAALLALDGPAQLANATAACFGQLRAASQRIERLERALEEIYKTPTAGRTIAYAALSTDQGVEER